MNKNKNIIKTLLLALPLLMISGSASAQETNCETQINACHDGLDACKAEDDACWEQFDGCLGKIEESCFSVEDFDLGDEDFDVSDEDFDQDVEDDFGDLEEVELSEEDDAALKACEDAYASCNEGNNTDCDSKLEICLFGEEIGDLEVEVSDEELEHDVVEVPDDLEIPDFGM